jgi:tRNA(Arg) A34 adenosine deaminase TadA
MKYLDLAIQVAKGNASRSKHFTFGCVALREDGGLICMTNIRTRDPMIQAHSETRALKRAGYGATLYVVRLDRAGNWCMAKPCVGCQSLIKNRGVRKVFYTVSENTYAVWNVR